MMINANMIEDLDDVGEEEIIKIMEYVGDLESEINEWEEKYNLIEDRLERERKESDKVINNLKEVIEVKNEELKAKDNLLEDLKDQVKLMEEQLELKEEQIQDYKEKANKYKDLYKSRGFRISFDKLLYGSGGFLLGSFVTFVFVCN